MAYWDIPRATTGARLLCEIGVEHGLTLEECLAGSGLIPASLTEPDAELAAWQELAVARNLATRLRHVPHLGFAAGLRHRSTTYGVAGLLLLSSPTLRAAATACIRFGQLAHVFSRTELVKEAEQTAVVFDAAALPADLRPFLVEREIAALAIAARDALGDPPRGCRIEFRHEGPRLPYRQRRLVGARPVFGTGHDRIVMANEMWDRPLPQADPRTCREAELHCREVLAQRLGRRTVSGQVLDRLRAGTERLPGLGQVAAALMTTARTLRRRLADEGTSFRALVEHVQVQRATELLAGRMSVERIADRLGYTDPSAFTQAFKRWTGVTPRAYRASLEHGGDPPPRPRG